MADGLLDTNPIVHALANDQHTAECLRFLAGLERGDRTAELNPLVVHEATYVLPRYVKQMARADVAQYLLAILSWPGIEADRATLVPALERWRDTPGLGFVDAYLAVLALRRGWPVYSKNVRDLRAQGVQVPEPLPG